MGRYVDWAFPVSVYFRSSDSQRVVTVMGTTKFLDLSTASAFVPMQLLSVSFSHVTPFCNTSRNVSWAALCLLAASSGGKVLFHCATSTQGSQQTCCLITA